MCQLSSLSEGEDHDWFYESDEEIIAEEHRRENCIIASLKAQRTRHQRSNSPRRRSVSPERRPTSKPRRNYKNLPLKNDGEIDYPVVLGRGIFRTTVLDAGQIDASDKFRNEMYVYPVGFIAKRKYNALESHDKKAIYFCSISKSADGLPQFEISTNNPQMRRLGNHESGAAADPGITLAFDNDIKALWNCFRNRFVPALQVSLDEEFPEPEAFFGLQHESLVKYYKDQLEMDAK